jgi:hypothetical protein
MKFLVLIVIIIIAIPFALLGAVRPSKGINLTAQEIVETLVDISQHITSKKQLLEYLDSKNILYTCEDDVYKWTLPSRVEIYKYLITYKPDLQQVQLQIQSDLTGIMPFIVYTNAYPSEMFMFVVGLEDMTDTQKSLIQALQNQGVKQELLGV